MFPANVAIVSSVLRPGGPHNVLILLVQLGGFEPPTSGSTDRRSNHLSYSCTRPLPGGRKLGAGPLFGKGFCPARGSHSRAAAFKTKSPGDWPGLLTLLTGV